MLLLLKRQANACRQIDVNKADTCSRRLLIRYVCLISIHHGELLTLDACTKILHHWICCLNTCKTCSLSLWCLECQVGLALILQLERGVAFQIGVRVQPQKPMSVKTQQIKLMQCSQSFTVSFTAARKTPCCLCVLWDTTYI
jgi:hypothetical protein